jgi:hypothetical protein
MTDKISDNEIVKALECCYDLDSSAICHQCPLYQTEDCRDGYLGLQAYHLINRLNAEIEEWQGGYMTQKQEIANLEIELKAMRGAANSYKAEIERLKKSNRNWRRKVQRLRAENKLLIDNDVSNKYPNCVLVEKGRIYTRTLEDYDELIGDISAEAYKEFAERLKAMAKANEWNGTICGVDIDNLLKELVGDENG